MELPLLVLQHSREKSNLLAKVLRRKPHYEGRHKRKRKNEKPETTSLVDVCFFRRFVCVVGMNHSRPWRAAVKPADEFVGVANAFGRVVAAFAAGGDQQMQLG